MDFNVYFIRNFLGILVLSWISDAIKADVQGNVAIGEEVLATLTNFISLSDKSGRRSFMPDKWDYALLETKAAFLCRNIELCENVLAHFINEYVMTLGKSIKLILQNGMHSKSPEDNQEGNEDGSMIFKNEYIWLLKDVKKILKTANKNVTDDNEANVMAGVIKKISSKFQRSAIAYATENIEGKSKAANEFKKRLIQKLVLAVAVVEEKYMRKLCVEHSICFKYIEVTRTVNVLLKRVETMSEHQIMMFMKAFYETISHTSFYSFLSEETTNQFQIILNDMSYTYNSPAKDILQSVLKSVESRLQCENSNLDFQGGFDQKLLNIILSDMDYIYRKRKLEPFHRFLNSFYEWLKSGKHIMSNVSHVMKDISHELFSAQEDIVAKLTNEVRVFLELTVDPETP